MPHCFPTLAAPLLAALVLFSPGRAAEPSGAPVEPVSFRHAGVTDAWKAYAQRLRFGEGQTLALVDDGCDLSRPEWANRTGARPKVLVSYDSVDGDDNPRHEGRGYHGTTIGIPSSLNHQGKWGVAYGNQVAVVRGLECCHCNVRDSKTLAAGLRWVLDHHQKYRITTVNLAPVDDQAHDRPVPTEIDVELTKLRRAGVWVSAPTGNHNFTTGISWPACQPSCFAVGAVKPGKDEVYLDRHAKVDLLVPAAATSSSNAIACGAAIVLREAVEKTGYDWRKNGNNLPEALLAVMQQTGKPVADPATKRTYRRLDLKAALDHIFARAAPGEEKSKAKPVEAAAPPSVQTDLLRPLETRVSPFDVGTAAQLFVDRVLVRDAERVWFTQHPGRKHPRNPVLKPDQPWEGWRAEIFGNVLYDQEEKLFKMWYLPEEGKAGAYFDDPNVTCYAVSKDGVTWEKPLVGTLKAKNGKPHNAVAHIHQASVLKDTADTDPARRYKCIGWSSQPSGYHTFVSPDGLHWTQHSQQPIARGGDVMTGFWDARRQLYVAFPKIYAPARGHPRRQFATIVSKDFSRWSESVFSFTVDLRDDAGSLARLEQVRPILDRRDDPGLMRTEYYGIGVYPAESCTLAFPWVFTINNNARWGNHEGPEEIQLAVSRDLVHWERPFRTPVIAIGEQDKWDASYHTTAATALRVKDEVWLYYSGANYTHGTPAVYRDKYEDGRPTGRKDRFSAAIGLVTWPLDRFVSADAGSDGGTLTTVPVRFGGERLEINAATKAGGQVVVELLDAAGKPLDGFPPSEPITGDDLRHRVRFQGGHAVSSLAGKPVVLRFRLKNASLYSFAFRAPEGSAEGSTTLPQTRGRLAAGKPLNVVCFGDSVTGVYYHTGGRRAYPEMLSLALRRSFPGAEVAVVNAGISGHSTRNALKRLESDVLAHKPHLVTVMFGLNDMVAVPLDEYRANLTTIVRKCHAAGAEVVLCTPNSVLDTPGRESKKLRDYCEALRAVARQEGVPVGDCYAVHEAARTRDYPSWRLLLSDEFHPNMDGHKLTAETIAKAVTGRTVSLSDAGPPQPAVQRTLSRLKTGEPVRVLAMPPYDALIGPALKKLVPSARVEVTAWPTAGKTLAQIEQDARPVRKKGVDLVLVAVPASARAESDEQAIRSFSWILNWSLSFGKQEWDVVGILPSVAKADLTPEERRQDAFARRMIRAQDLSVIERGPGDTSPAEAILAGWLREQFNGGTK